MKTLGLIPARYASTRFPGKPLAEIAGKSMIQRVYEQALKAKLLTDVVVATDDDRIFRHVQSFGGKCVMTNPNHPSGTDRCYEAALNTGKKFDLIVNIQGDEPFMNPENIDALVQVFNQKDIHISTLICPLIDAESILSKDVVKVVINKNSDALYFSRFPIPFLRNQSLDNWLEMNNFYQHLGIYAYQFETLKQLVELQPSTLEKAESLEQLRWLEAGFSIHTIAVAKTLPGIDTPQDLMKAEDYLKNNSNGNQ